MSFYTALTGLNAATAQLEITSNNIANVNTSGFKRSRADFGDIFATSPLQKASAVIGQGVALKGVSQEFSQGNIQASANALDLAISGDGFFQLKSADGLQNVYTRNGSFTLNDQYNVVSSAGQALQAASVDSSGKADLSNLNRLTIPKKTAGDARQTSLVQLGLNFPADASVITSTFSRSNPASYNKTTALTVYDQGGNGYLATVYYVKTQNASQASPTNKWQTYVYIGENQVNASLLQATSETGEQLYVNKYGQLAPQSQVSDKLVNKKTAMFELNELSDTRISQPASISGAKTQLDLTAEVGVTLSELTSANKAALSHLLQIDVDGSGKPVTLDISALAGRSGKVTGATLAREMTTALNMALGDSKYFDLTKATDRQFTINYGGTTPLQIDLGMDVSNAGTQVLSFTLPNAGVTDGTITINGKTMTGISSTTTQASIAAFFAAQLDHVVDLGDGTIKIYKPSAASVITPTVTGTGTAVSLGATVALTAIPAATSSLGKTQTIVFSAPTAAGTITVGGATKTYTQAQIEAGVTAQDVAAYFAGALSLTNNGDGSITKSNPNATFDDVSTDMGVSGAAVFSTSIGPTLLKTAEMVNLVQGHVDAAISEAGLSASMAIKVEYDAVAQRFTFTQANGGNALSLRGGGRGATGSSNELFGLTNISAVSAVAEDGTYSTANGAAVIPNGAAIRQGAAQRYGVSVEYDSVSQQFKFLSGSTGDASTIAITGLRDYATTLLGLSGKPAVNATSSAVRGLASKPAVTTGTPVAINVANNFGVDITNNTFIVTVDDVKGTVKIPVNANYTLDGFIGQLQTQINNMAGANGSTVSGVIVSYDRAANALKFTTGSQGSNSFIQVSGNSTWGLANVPAGRGQTSSWIKPTQHVEYTNGVANPKYIDERGAETSSSDGFSGLTEWSPIYLHKGELTFNTAGSLISPKTGAQLDTVFLNDGKGALRININYSKSTQFSSPFAVLSQSQDGAPEGDLIGVNIADDGLVNASYSNGSQKSLGKIALINFSNPNGLRQIGDSSFYASSASGTPKAGEAGGAGFGTIRAGATERANVDLTHELVDLITGQRNFQASAKAIETNTTLTQAIINIRS